MGQTKGTKIRTMLVEINHKVVLGLQLPLELGRQHEAHGPLLGLGGWVLLHSTI